MNLKKKYPELVAGAISGIIIFFIGFAIWIVAWYSFFKEKYVWDLSIDISNILELMVIVIALFGPFIYSYVKRRNQCL